MKRTFWIVSAVAAVLLILAALIWRGGDVFHPPHSESAGEAPSQSEPLSPEEQTPVQEPQDETLSAASDGSENDDADSQQEAAPQYSFHSAEEALNYYADLVALEFDLLKLDDSVVPPENLSAYDDTFVSWEDRWYGGVATGEIFDKIFERDEEPDLKQALAPFLNDWKEEEWGPDYLMVRAGRWPSALLRREVTLPDGQTLDLHEMRDKLVVVKYQKRMTPTEDALEAMREAEARISEIETRLASGGVSESGAAELQNELAGIQADLAEARKPKYADIEEKYYAGGKLDEKENEDGSVGVDTSGVERVVIELGKIEKDARDAK